ncbi:MAG: cytochrome C oxidase subunit I [Burkholderiales bacterium]|jgi:hypothetical protein|nr:MAG: cytochrome C oxidase subunit I [Burkholderiales bacterium]
MTETVPASRPASHWRRYRTLYLLLAVCVAPVLASYTAYYLLPPSGRTNYGTLVEPQRPLPALSLRRLDGTAVQAASLRGSWLMVQVDGGACDAACEQKLWKMRQVRLTTGKDADRVQRLWLIVDEAPLATLVMREYDGTLFLRARADELAAFLPLPAEPGAGLAGPIWLIDPLGNLMLRWPKDADPSRMKKDLIKLLKTSKIG